jgi:hypothetical protein
VEVGGGGGVFHIGEGTHFWGCIAGFWTCFILGGELRLDLLGIKFLIGSACHLL